METGMTSDMGPHLLHRLLGTAKSARQGEATVITVPCGSFGNSGEGLWMDGGSWATKGRKRLGIKGIPGLKSQLALSL